MLFRDITDNSLANVHSLFCNIFFVLRTSLEAEIGDLLEKTIGYAHLFLLVIMF